MAMTRYDGQNTLERRFLKDGKLRESARLLLRELFLEQVQQSGDCWLWTGRLIKNSGYGGTNISGRHMPAHRLAYWLWNGELTPGLSICHTCDVRRCVKPSHLWEGTTQDNMADMDRKGRRKGNGYEQKTHCPRGHAYDGENTKWYEGRRYCRACHRLHTRDYARRHRGYVAKPRACVICGADITGDGRRKYCSPQCRNTRLRQRFP